MSAAINNKKPPQEKNFARRASRRRNRSLSPWCFKEKCRSRYDRTSGVPMFANGAISGAMVAAFGNMRTSGTKLARQCAGPECTNTDIGPEQEARLRNILAGVRGEHFGDIPADHAIDIEVANIDNAMEIAHNPDGSLNPNLIRVAPGVAGLTDGQIGLYFGHELVHVQDLLVSPFVPGTAAGYRSEVRAYQWEINNLNSFVSGMQRVDVKMQLQNYLLEAQSNLRRTELGY